MNSSSDGTVRARAKSETKIAAPLSTQISTTSWSVSAYLAPMVAPISAIRSWRVSSLSSTDSISSAYFSVVI